MELNKILKILAKIEEATALLDMKRATLEEKMIKAYFQDLAEVIQRVIATINSRTAAGVDLYTCAPLLKDMTVLSSEILAALDDFIRSANYNLNYLEQYYEYQFLQRLQNDSQFIERGQQIYNNLQASIQG